MANGETQIIVEDDRTGMSRETVERAVLDHLYYTCSKDRNSATPHDVYLAVAHAVRDRLVQRWIRTQREYYSGGVKRAYYLSAEFLLGRFLGDNLLKLGLWDTCVAGLRQYGLEMDEVLGQETDPGLGNGGLGRLAACFLESLATLGLPGYGYGIRYEYGIFEQRIKDGWQLEVPDDWLSTGSPWELPRYEYTVPVHFYGRCEHGAQDGPGSRWVGTSQIIGVPYDMPIAGYGNDTVNTLRLWSAHASKQFDLQVFNAGDYRAAVEEKALAESISKVLYPPDSTLVGKELRLKQQYFFVACSIADIIRRYEKEHDGFHAFPDQVAIQLNDTHPSIAVAELMRFLMDERHLGWEEAWDITQSTISYTNHTLLSEALERWPVSLFERVLPRHLEIIYEINHRFLKRVRIHAPGDDDRVRRMSLIEEGPEPSIRMAYLATVGSHKVNGVAALHSQLLRDNLLRDFSDMFPERFTNKTNGVTPRRFMLMANRPLAQLISEKVGSDRWVRELDEVRALEAFVDDDDVLDRLQRIKRANKERLAGIIWDRLRIRANPDAIFDVQIKRIHEYKRQLLNLLHIVSLYWRLKDDPSLELHPRVFVFGGKAAPGYWIAKLIIKLIHDVADAVNHDRRTKDLIQVAFLPNYSVSLAERIIPGSDVSEQISMAGKEASGTGNMKFAMNGALTIGTLDGANIEIREEVGADNFFLFGLTADEVKALDREGYDPRAYIERSPDLSRAIGSIAEGFFSPDDERRFQPLVDELTGRDTYKHCADFEAYAASQREVEAAYRQPRSWTQKALLNIARIGKFSSDRTIREYAEEIWDIHPVEVRLTDDEPEAPVRAARPRLEAPPGE
ncbi:MAG: glycogen/starch/alpha-glucan phosphorylase [Sandaracinaceae bacterium]